MLTEAEKTWLEKRVKPCIRCDDKCGPMLTRHNLRENPACNCFYRSDVAYVDYKDAAEFEARVAKRVLLLPPCAGLGKCIESDPGVTCEACRLKHSRLIVEEEMP